MSIRYEDIALLERLKGPNNPQVNIFTLDRVLNETIRDKEGYSFKCKTLIFFLYKVFDKDRHYFDIFIDRLHYKDI